MFIYISLFLASLVVLLFARLVWKAISSVYKAVSKPGKPVYRPNERVAITDSIPGHRKNGRARSASNEDLIPLDLENRATAWDLAETHPSIPETHHIQNSAWLLREDKRAAVGKAYKIKRKSAQELKTLDKVSQPWKRKVAPWIQNPEFVDEDLKPVSSSQDAER